MIGGPQTVGLAAGCRYVSLFLLSFSGDNPAKPGVKRLDPGVGERSAEL